MLGGFRFVVQVCVCVSVIGVHVWASVCSVLVYVISIVLGQVL